MLSARAHDVLIEYKTRETGLFPVEVHRKQQQFGYNSIEKQDHYNLIKIFGHQFSDLMVIILLIAGTLAFIFASYRDAAIIFLIVSVNATIGFFQEFKVERTLSALSRLLPKKVRVLRADRESEILASLVVPGDIINLQSGEYVPADAIIIEAQNLEADESALSGESRPVDKQAVSGVKIENREQLFMGTTIIEGTAKAVVTAIGLKTRFGHIADQTSKIKTDFSPLQKKLNQMSKFIARLALLILLIFVVYGIITGKDIISNFLFALALAAAIVPEGLPATISVALSLAARRLANKKALIKKLTSTETLGAATVICTDKTGTLTHGTMRIGAFWSPSQGKNDLKKLKIDQLTILKNIFALNSHAQLINGKSVGDFNEISLLSYLIDHKVDFEKIRKNYPILYEISFTSDRKMMSVVVQIEQEYWLLVKGRPDVIFKHCHFKIGDRQKAVKAEQSFSELAHHNLAFAYKKLGSSFHIPGHKTLRKNNKFDSKLETNLNFLGILSFIDPIKPGVKEAVSSCHRAGIRIVMITGDVYETALSVSHKINFFDNQPDKIYRGSQLDRMTDFDLRSALQNNVVFAEVDPEHKLRIVENLRALGEIVAVTGDGVNDAPALKQADIGIAMGEKGTDVAKEAADMILLDDNFATIVKAIYEGRTIFSNIQKIIYYIFASNSGELLTVIFGILFHLPLPIIAVQILAIDLGTDVLPSLALAADDGKRDLMAQPAKHKMAILLDRQNLKKLFITGLIMGVGANLSFYLLIRLGFSYTIATTSAYTTIVLCQIISAVFTHLDFRGNLFFREIFNNKYLVYAEIFSALLLLSIIYLKPFQYVLKTGPLNLVAWSMPIITMLVLVIAGRFLFIKKELN